MRKRKKIEPTTIEKVCKNCKRWIWISSKTGFCRMIYRHDGYTTKEDFPSTPNNKCEKYEQRKEGTETGI